MEMENQNTNAQDDNTGLVVCYIVGAIFLLIGFGFLTHLVLLPLAKKRAIENWTSVKCEILECKVGSHEMTGGARGGGSSYTTNYSIDVTYSYEYDSERYESNNYDLKKEHYKKVKTARDIVKSLTNADDTVICYVNPEDPAEAYLSTKLYLPIMRTSQSIVAICIGLFVLIMTLRSHLHARFGDEQ